VPELPRLGRSGSGRSRQPVAGHPLAQASERAKRVLIGGKGVRFDDPRKYTGVFIGFLVLALGYGCFVGLKAFFHSIEGAGAKRAASLDKRIKDADEAKQKRFDGVLARTKSQQNPNAGSAAAPEAVAPVAASTAQLLIDIESVRQGQLFPPDQREFLEVNLRVKNESKVLTHKAAWSGPKVKATLRDVAFNHYQLLQPPAQDKMIASGESIRESIYFERVVPGNELTLDLMIPEGAMTAKKQFKIPPANIKNGP
jgi:hypothetical protein